MSCEGLCFMEASVRLVDMMCFGRGRVNYVTTDDYRIIPVAVTVEFGPIEDNLRP